MASLSSSSASASTEPSSTRNRASTPRLCTPAPGCNGACDDAAAAVPARTAGRLMACGRRSPVQRAGGAADGQQRTEREHHQEHHRPPPRRRRRRRALLQCVHATEGREHSAAGLLVAGVGPPSAVLPEAERMDADSERADCDGQPPPRPGSSPTSRARPPTPTIATPTALSAASRHSFPAQLRAVALPLRSLGCSSSPAAPMLRAYAAFSSQVHAPTGVSKRNGAVGG